MTKLLAIDGILCVGANIINSLVIIFFAEDYFEMMKDTEHEAG